MELLPYLRTQVRANRLANHRLHTALLGLSQGEYLAPRTGFFPSLAATLDHILAVDLYYLAALHGDAGMVRVWEEAPECDSAAALAREQAAADERFIAHVDGLDDAALADTIELLRGEGRIQREARVHVVAHLLQHQVHHRGQAHAMLSGTSVKPPQLDEFLMPSEARLREHDMASLGWTEPALYAR